MDPKSLAALEPPNTEFVLGIVAAVGTDLDHFAQILSDYLKKFGYTSEPVRLTDLFRVLDLPAIGQPIDDADPCKQISLRMDGGNLLRREAGRGDVLALHAAAKIHHLRKAKRPTG